MRRAAYLLIALVIAVPVTAEEGFTLGLEATAITDEAEIAPQKKSVSLQPPARPSAHDDYALVYRTALKPASDKEFTLALWDAPLGRTLYAVAADQAMLGREGLVGGGRMVGLGMSSSALGDGTGGSLGRLMSGARWYELSVK